MHLLKQSIANELQSLSLIQDNGLGSIKALVKLFSTPPNPKLGDLAFPCFQLAKALQTKPAEIAEKLQSALEEQAHANQSSSPSLWKELKVVGPYLNFFFDQQLLAQSVLHNVHAQSPGQDLENWHYGENDQATGKRIAIDYSSPNIAKPLGVHHLRSTMIGHSLKQIYQACGWEVLGVNHLGDWGTSFGLLIAAFKRAYTQELAKLPSNKAEAAKVLQKLFIKLSVADLNKLYVDYSGQAKSDQSLHEQGKQEFLKLEAELTESFEASGSQPETSEKGYLNALLWHEIRLLSIREFEKVYALLNVTFTPYPFQAEMQTRYAQEAKAFLQTYSLYTGESFYLAGSTFCEKILEEAKQKGVAEKSDGALVIFVAGKDAPPLFLLKNDGTTSYHIRDLAAALQRQEDFKVEKALYVVGSEQKLHFKQLFQGLKMLGYSNAEHYQHVDFGLVLMKDETTQKWGKFSTRQGRVILLNDLLHEAIEKVKAIITEKNPELASKREELEQTAKAVGVGAVVFHDLKHGRRSNVKFDWDEMLNFQGETGPYLLYQYVRLTSLARKYQSRFGNAPADLNYALLGTELECELLKKIADFPDTVQAACDDNEPSVISRYLLDLASCFSSYWSATKNEGIIGSDQALSSVRVNLVSALRKVLGKGLRLLGLELVEEM